MRGQMHDRKMKRLNAEGQISRLQTRVSRSCRSGWRSWRVPHKTHRASGRGGIQEQPTRKVLQSEVERLFDGRRICVCLGRGVGRVERGFCFALLQRYTPLRDDIRALVQGRDAKCVRKVCHFVGPLAAALNADLDILCKTDASLRPYNVNLLMHHFVPPSEILDPRRFRTELDQSSACSHKSTIVDEG